MFVPSGTRLLADKSETNCIAVRASERAAPVNVDLACRLAHAATCASRRSKPHLVLPQSAIRADARSPRGISLSLGLVEHIDFAGQGEGTIEKHAAARAGLGRQRAGSRTA
jgi:hypothetical protein